MSRLLRKQSEKKSRKNAERLLTECCSDAVAHHHRLREREQERAKGSCGKAERGEESDRRKGTRSSFALTKLHTTCAHGGTRASLAVQGLSSQAPSTWVVLLLGRGPIDTSPHFFHRFEPRKSLRCCLAAEFWAFFFMVRKMHLRVIRHGPTCWEYV